MKVWKIQVDGLCGPVIWTSRDDAADEINSHMREMETGESISIEIGAIEMSQRELDALKEFEGY